MRAENQQAAPAGTLADVMRAFGDLVVVLRAVRDESGRIVDGVIEYANPAWCRAILGSADIDPAGSLLLDRAPMFRDRLETHRHVVETGESVRVEIPIDSLGRWFDVAYIRFGDGLLAVSRDVTARHEAELAQQASEASYRLLFESMTSGCALHRIIRDESGVPCDYRFLEVNRAHAAILGRTPEEVIGRTVKEILPGIEPAWIDRFGEVATTGVAADFEDYSVDLDRTYHVVAYSPEPEHFAVIVEDISGRARDARALRASEARSRAMSEELARAQRIAHVGSWTMDRATGSVAWSDELYRIVGREPGSPLPTFWTRLAEVTPEVQARRSAAAERALATGQPFEMEYDIARSDGALRHVVSRGEAVRDEAGTITGLRGTIADVTGQWAAAAAVRASEERFRTTIDTLIDPLVVIRAVRDDAGMLVDFVYDYANDAACAYDRLPREWLVGRLLSDVAPGHGPSGLFAMYADVLATGAPLIRDAPRYEDTTLFEVDQARRLLDIRASRVGDALAVTWRDVTYQRELADSLGRAARAESVGRLAGGVAHDFNNLLGVINGNAEFLAERLPPDDPGLAEIAAIRAATAKAVALTRQLLAFGRRGSVNRSLFHPGAAVSALAPMLRSLVPAGIDLWIEADEGAGAVHADPAQFEQAVVNLVINARDAMPDGGSIRIVTDRVTARRPDAAGSPPSPPAEYVRVTVADTGSGIDPEVLPHVFEPFFTTKASGQGSGLGLSSVEGAAAQADGFVTVESVPGEGSTFALHIPAARDASAPAPEPADGAIPAVPGGAETILLVEDEPGVRAVTARILHDLGYGVIEADAPAAALVVLADPGLHIDLLLTDVIMPGMSGLDLALRMAVGRPAVPVLFMSGYVPESDEGGGLLGPDSEVLPKPFGRAELAERVRSLLDRRSTVDRAAEPGPR
jgi:PAS domain S-box-containing protein